MITSTAQRQYTSPVIAWRPLPADVSDLLCVESSEHEIGPWMHARPAITLTRSRAIVRLESRRSVQVERDTVLLVPPLHAYSIRLVEEGTAPVVTLLPGLRPAVKQSNTPALTTRADLVAAVAQLVSDPAREILPVLEQLAMESAVIAPKAIGIATPLLPLRDYLRAHLSAPVPTATLAEMAGLTEWHCIRAFHHEFGLPPHAYHMRLRLAEASRLLATGQSVSTVAYDCGFADQSHLSRKFKEIYGMAPAGWASVAGSDTQRIRSMRGQRAPLSVMRPERLRRQHAEKWQS